MHSDVSPMTYLRGKCRVLHRDHLPTDIESYKREPDSFYYHQVRGLGTALACVLDNVAQLYDRYLHRYFDLIPTHRIQNAPGPQPCTQLCV
jgi:hypothetical protein